jgi:3-methyl-2-oxobutanoate hydroxymethyltransferase
MAAGVCAFMDIKAHFFEMKRKGQPIAVLTAYDFPTAKAEAEAGVDLILVGDSVGTNLLGYASEQDVQLADIAHHVRAVRRGAPGTPILADLPYRTYETPELAVANARALRDAGADMVKFEGARPEIAGALISAGIAVCGHLGLEPQTHLDKKLRGRSAAEANQLVSDAIALDKAGVAMLVLELIPEVVATRVTQAIGAPTIGIGAGRHTDGQVLVITDLLGITGASFRHNRRYAELGPQIATAMAAYVRDVRDHKFPTAANTFAMPEEALLAFENNER